MVNLDAAPVKDVDRSPLGRVPRGHSAERDTTRRRQYSARRATASRRECPTVERRSRTPRTTASFRGVPRGGCQRYLNASLSLRDGLWNGVVYWNLCGSKAVPELARPHCATWSRVRWFRNNVPDSSFG
ncbi:hypothetical protein MRX96_021439 [Rhipicephalus microplus]